MKKSMGLIKLRLEEAKLGIESRHNELEEVLHDLREKRELMVEGRVALLMNLAVGTAVTAESREGEGGDRG